MSSNISFLLDKQNAEDLVRSIPYAEYLGIRIEQDINGQMVFRMPFDEKLIGNPMIRAIHGGILAGFMESSATMAVIGIISHDHLPKCVNMTVEYLKSTRPVDTLAKVRINNPGRRIVHLTVDCWQEERGSVALAHCRFLAS